MFSYYFSAPLAFLLSSICIWLILRMPENFIALDRPNSRSLHEVPTPRVGGVAILVGIIFPFCLFVFLADVQFNYSLILAALILVAGVSIIDDFYSISFFIRLIVHVSAAFLVVSFGYVIENFSTTWGVVTLPSYIATIITVLFIVWMINLYNFMDGIDGLAGGMAAFGFGTFAIIGFLEGQSGFAVTSLVIASSSLGFLLWNYPPARIFMGDSGSSSLGFLAATLSIWAHLNELISIWISFVIFSPFIVDATVTLIRRIIMCERFWDAHKTHYYQLVAESGVSRKRLVNFEYGLMLVSSVMAIFIYNATSVTQVSSILMLLIIYVILFIYAKKMFDNAQKIIRS